MEGRNHSSKPFDQGKYVSRSVYTFMHATVTLSESKQMSNRQNTQWTGVLVNLSYDGARITLPSDSEKYFTKQQNVAMRIKATLIDTDISLTAQVKDIVPTNFPGAVYFDVQFTGLESNPDAQDAIRKIYEYGEKLKTVRKTQ
jgi:hypothetical protein